MTPYFGYTVSPHVDCVTLCRWPAKQTIPLSVLARNQTKGFGLEISAGPEVVTGREKRVGWTKELTELATGHGQGQSTPDTGAVRPVGGDGVQTSERRLSQRFQRDLELIKLS